jgi:hypothetical protein
MGFAQVRNVQPISFIICIVAKLLTAHLLLSFKMGNAHLVGVINASLGILGMVLNVCLHPCTVPLGHPGQI